MIKPSHYKHYVFLEQIDDITKRNLLNFRSINIIINIDDQNEKNEKHKVSIIKFAKKNKIPFLVKNNFQKCVKYKANGIYIEANNKTVLKPMLLIKDFIVVGSAHNQLEYRKKVNQNCKLIMLSPLFKNEKYSNNKVLNTIKFNQIKRGWKIDVCALGGINLKNLKKIKLTNCKAFAFNRLIFEPEMKKPAYNIM